MGMDVYAYIIGPRIWEKLDSSANCDTLDAVHFKTKNKKSFEICKNREIVDEEGGVFSVSYLKNCPASYPLKNEKKGCVSCDGLKDVIVINKEDCNACSNREVRTEEYEDFVDGKKVLKHTHHCQLKQCPENAPLRGEGDCLSCEEDVWTDDPKETCDKCSNRQFIDKGEVIFVGIKDGNRWIKKTAHAGCYLKEYKYESEESRPLFSVSLEDEVITPPCEDGKLCAIYDHSRYIYRRCSDISQYDCEHMQDFYPCDRKYEIETLPEVCAKCPNRDYVEGMCIFRECPVGSIRKTDDNYYDLCIECNYDQWDIEITTEEECRKCPNRFWGMTMADDGKYVCAHCNIDDGYITTEDECTRCPQRDYYPETKMCVLKGMTPQKDETSEIFLEWKSDPPSIQIEAIPLRDLKTPELPSPPKEVPLF